MQKVLQRTARAERVAARKHAKLRDHQEKGESWSRFQQRNRNIRVHGANIKNARNARREDWETGALAPRRDVGDKAAVYGSMAMYDVFTPELDPEKRPKWVSISEGDRVVVIKGREKGRIGPVIEYNERNATVRITGVNMTDVQVPEWMNREDNTQGDLTTLPRPIALEDVRLVYPLPDPETGVPRDVVIDRLVRVNHEFDKDKKEWTEGDRVIAGTKTIIPWPPKAEPQYEDHEDDTLRITVEEQTFRPFLLHPPMPLSVIDELRNKYSRFRTRHDYEYIEKKELEDAKVEQRKELIKGMRTPLQELAEVRKKQKAEQEKELTEGQLAKIGEVIAMERSKAMGSVRQMAAPAPQ